MLSAVVPSKVRGEAPRTSEVMVNVSVAASPIVTVPFKAVVPETVAVDNVIDPLPKAIVGSVPPDASKVQVIAVPAPKVVVLISVVSRLRVTVSVALSTVSIPLVPPAMVKVLPSVIDWPPPESPAAVKLVIPPPAEQLVNAGAPPLAEVRQRVPAPPVAVYAIVPFPSVE